MREFLSTRRARLTPQDAGLPAGGRRRVPGLRREEVAALVGISVDYYIRIERGNLAGVSDGVLEALAAALEFDDAERAYLGDLARFANAPAARSGAPAARAGARPQVVRIIEAMTGAAGFVANRQRDILASNALGRALFSPLFAARSSAPANLVRFAFLDPAARGFFADWEAAAAMIVGNLRAETGRDPANADLVRLVKDLSARSGDFSRLWGAHDVHAHRSGTKSLNHPEVGYIDLSYEVLELPVDPGQVIIVYTAQPGTPAARRLALLAERAGRTGRPEQAGQADAAPVPDTPAPADADR